MAADGGLQLLKVLRVYQSPGPVGMLGCLLRAQGAESEAQEWALGKSDCSASLSLMVKVNYLRCPWVISSCFGILDNS